MNIGTDRIRTMTNDNGGDNISALIEDAHTVLKDWDRVSAEADCNLPEPSAVRLAYFALRMLGSSEKVSIVESTGFTDRIRVLQ